MLSVLAEGTVSSSWGSQRRLGICGDDVADEKNIPYRYASAHNQSLPSCLNCLKELTLTA